MRSAILRFFILVLLSSIAESAIAQTPLAQSPPQGSQAQATNQLAQKPGAQLITLDQAIQMAIEHNHNLLAARTTIQQNEAEEITANLRPDPVLLGDSQFLPIFQPSNFSSDYLDNTAQFDLGVSYLFERGKKRQNRLQAAKDQTAVTRWQVADNERTLTFNVATDFINVELAESTLELANRDLKSFQDTVDITEARYKAGDIGLDDLLKMKLQLLQFQTDVAQAKLARVQGLSDLRQLLGYEQVSADYDVAGSFDYQPMKGGLEDMQAAALKSRPDLQAAQQGIAAANSAFNLQKAIGKRDVTGQINYTHIGYLNDVSLFGSMQLPIFDRNQGEIKRAGIRDYAGAGAATVRERAGADGCEGRVRGLEGERRDCGAVPLRLSRRGAAIARHYGLRIQARSGQFAGLSGCRAEFSRNATRLPAGAGIVPAGAGAASRSGRDQELTMRHPQKMTRGPAACGVCGLYLCTAGLAGCHSKRQCERNDFVFVEGIAVGNAAVVHDSRGPDEPRATGDDDAGDDDEHAAIDGRGGL